MSNSESIATVHAWIEGFRDAADNYYPRAAQAVATICKTEIDAAIAEQRSVQGKAWKPRQMMRRGKVRPDAKSALVLLNAAKAVTTKAIGSVVMIILEGPEVFDQFGAGRKPKREIIPGTGLGKLGNAIANGIVDMGAPWMTRKGRHDKGSGGVRMSPKMGGGQ